MDGTAQALLRPCSSPAVPTLRQTLAAVDVGDESPSNECGTKQDGQPGKSWWRHREADTLIREHELDPVLALI
jgi:hypothetical protein